MKLYYVLLVCCLLISCSRRPVPAPTMIAHSQLPAIALFAQGLEAEAAQNWEAAMAHFAAASQEDAASGRIYTHWAWCLAQLNLPDEAVAKVQIAEKLCPADDYLLYFDMGNVYALAGNYPEAQRCYEKSLTIDGQFQKGVQALMALMQRQLEQR